MMDKAAETKRQHYVPRFLLKNFSPDEHRISLFILSSGRRVDAAPIKRQCYEDYFYGKDDVMEKSFSKEEGYVANALGDLGPDRLESLTAETLDKLRYFIHYQRARTLGSAESLNAMIDAFAKSALEPVLAQRVGAQPKNLDLVRIGISDAQNEALWAAATATPLLWDLEVKFLFTERTPGFIIGDHPVVAYNQYAEHHPDFQHCLSMSHLAAKGLQMFLPLSPNVTLAVFDPSAYQYGSPRRRVCRVGPSDVETLNRMQMIQALRCAYFSPDRIADNDLAGLHEARKQHRSVYQRDTLKSAIIERPDGKRSQIVAVGGGELRLGAKLSIVRLMDHKRYYGYDRAFVIPRSPELLAFARSYGDELNRMVEQRRSPTAAPDT